MSNDRRDVPAAALDVTADAALAGIELALGAPVDRGTRSTLAALRSRNFRLLWSGMIVNSLGRWMQTFGLGVLVVQLAFRDGVPNLAPLYLGLIGLSQAVPGFSLGVFGGAVADRTDRRRLLLVTQLSSSAVAASLAALTIFGRIDLLEIMALASIASIVTAFEAPTRQSLAPGLVPPAAVTSAVGLSSAALNSAQMIGPLLGGLLYVPFGLGGLFVINALGYLAGLALIWSMDPHAIRARPAGSVLFSIREGFAYIWGDRLTRSVVVLSFFAALLARPYPQLLPAVTAEVLRVGPIELSWLLAASGAGSLGGALAVASLGGIRHRGVVLVGAVAALGILVATFALQRTLIGALVVMACVGFAALLQWGMANTILQTRTPDRLRGRVTSVHVTSMLGLVPLGAMILGTAGTLFGLSASLFGGGALLAIVAIVASRSPTLRRAG